MTDEDSLDREMKLNEGWLRRYAELNRAYDKASCPWCICEEGPYFGAQLVGTPLRCERCGRDESMPPWMVTELSLNLKGPPAEDETHPETTPVGPFVTREAADAWAAEQARQWGGGSWTIAPVRKP
jgi:hypothetical protein